MSDGKPGTDGIDAKIASLGDWRGTMLARLRTIILSADDGIAETVKWGGTPVWEKEGILTTGETYKGKVKLTFAHGAKLDDPLQLFNSGLEGNSRRAIDLFEGDAVDEVALRELVRAAVAFNGAKKKS